MSLFLLPIEGAQLKANKKPTNQTPYATCNTTCEQQDLRKPVVPKVLDLICYWFAVQGPFQKQKMGAKFYQFKMIHVIYLSLEC